MQTIAPWHLETAALLTVDWFLCMYHAPGCLFTVVVVLAAWQLSRLQQIRRLAHVWVSTPQSWLHPGAVSSTSLLRGPERSRC